MNIILTLIDYKTLHDLKVFKHLMNPIFAVCLCKTKKLSLFKRLFFLFRLQKLLILCIVLWTNSVYSQYTGVINSNRPGLSESPYSVGTGVYQLEASLFYSKAGMYPTFSRPQSQGVDFLFRTSFFKEQLEINVNLALQKDLVSFQNIFDSNFNSNGIATLSIAAKYLIYQPTYKDKSKEIRSWVKRNEFDWKRMIPSIAGYIGINTNKVNEVYKKNGISPKVGILLQQQLSNDFNIITNIFYDYIGTEAPELSYIITATYNFDERWSTFFENQTTFNKYLYQSNIGTGLAFLFNRNIQLNSSLRLLTNEFSTGYYSSLGISYRLDKHRDKIINLDEDGNPIEDGKKLKGNKKRIFSGLFNKVTNLFKKKGKKKSSTASKLKKKTIESIAKNINTSSNDSLSSNPVRVRPTRSRSKPSKIKTKKSNSKDIKTKKGFLGLKKVKSKSKEKKNNTKPDTEKEEKQLEREIKILEREIKKDEAKKEKEQKRLEKEKKKEEKKKKKKKKNENKKKKDENNQ